MTTVRHRKYYSLLRSPGAEENMNNQRELISEKSCSFKKMKIIILSSCFNSCSSIIYYVHQKILMLLMTFFFQTRFIDVIDFTYFKYEEGLSWQSYVKATLFH